MRVFLHAVVIQVLLSIYVFWRGWQILPNRKYIRIPYAAIFVLEILIYFIGFFGAKHLSFELLHDFTWLGTTWMVFIIYMSSLLLFYDAVQFINKKKRILPHKIKLDHPKLRRYYFLASFVCVAVAMIYGSYRFYNPVVTEMTLEVKKDNPDVKNLKIALVADIHVGFLIDRKILSMYVDKIMEQKPDIILLAGDIIDYDIRSVREQNMEEEFRRLKAPYGVYASTGNHEYIELDEEKYGEKVEWLIEKSGMTVLRDSAHLVANSFYIVGREDDMFKERKPLSDIMRNVDKTKPIIVMNHEPKRLNEELEAGADIALYGHTHNGQLFPYNFVIGILYELGYGYKKKGDTHFYVTSGLGLAGPQYRIGTLSEIVILNVKFGK